MKKLLPFEASILGGELAFDENGDPRGAQFYIFQIEDGEHSLVTD